jgi:RNA polymerase sigma factor (sigma-70 family)
MGDARDGGGGIFKLVTDWDRESIPGAIPGPSTRLPLPCARAMIAAHKHGMIGSDPQAEFKLKGAAAFATTRWSVILAASRSDPDAQAGALEQLCRTYWYPLYAYIRRRGYTPHDAEDLTQEFFSRLLSKEWLLGIEPYISRFRSFLLTALNRFLANEYDRTRAAKRGGGQRALSLDILQAETRYLQEPSTHESPERIYERRWALTVLDRALSRLRDETETTGKSRLFQLLNPFLSQEPEDGQYASIAAELKISPGAVGVSVHRIRHRYRELVRAEIAETVAREEEIEAEMRHLVELLR